MKSCVRIALTDQQDAEHEVVDCSTCRAPTALMVDEERCCCYRCGRTSVLTPLGLVDDSQPDRATRLSARMLCGASTVIRSFALGTQPSEAP